MFIADFHIHSKYSRATSKDCEPESLDFWARRKGLDLIGTGDFTHAAWRRELREKLAPSGEGLYALKESFIRDNPIQMQGDGPRFIVSGEISSIYKKNGKVRKVHNVILLPGLDAADRLALRLEAIGNLHSDGRPILGLDSRDLLEITLEACPEAIFIPAHIWTPHFSLFGAYSGFDDIHECFEDLTDHIHALETGLSSDPPMNWRLSALDSYILVSNSDAHSPGNLAREANLFDTKLSYPAIAKALSHKDAPGFHGTIEFFPEEGKYHYDGHRSCGVCQKPELTRQTGGVCPACGRKITVGVLHRVEALADRQEGFVPAGARPFESIVPLLEVVAASTGLTGVKGGRMVEHLLRALGPELVILRQTPLDEIARQGGPLLSEGVRRLREGKVHWQPGYDGEYGKAEILDQAERISISGQMSLFGEAELMLKKNAAPPKTKSRKKITRLNNEESGAPTSATGAASAIAPASQESSFDALNEAQKEAAHSMSPVTAVIAGPGTGKTKTLTNRIAYLIEERGVRPEQITAVTFTNKAAGEMRVRLEKHFGDNGIVKSMRVGTFHSICLRLLIQNDLIIIDEIGALSLLSDILKDRTPKISPRAALREISLYKNEAKRADGVWQEITALYNEKLTALGAMDYDDILLKTRELYSGPEEAAPEDAFAYLLADEFQDVNPVQYQLLRAWAGRGKSLFVIGDPLQSIYGFRGADARCFDWLTRDYPGAALYELNQNYRSTPEIVACANWISPGRANLTAVSPHGPKIRIVQTQDSFSEALFVTKEIVRMVGGIDMLGSTGQGRAFSEIALLYRTNRQADMLEECLVKEGVPYTVTGKERFLSEPEAARTLAFFRCAVYPGDLLSRAICQNAFAWDAETFSQTLHKYRALLDEKNPQDILEAWARENRLAEAPCMQKLFGMALFHENIKSMLQTLAFGSESDFTRSGGKTYHKDAVTLSTLHGAKGLEYPVVFLCGLNDGSMPRWDRDGTCDLEEERRLFYVGATRAREELILLVSGAPSPFLANLHQEAFVQRETLARAQTFEQFKLF
ncbi:MAG: UvrD-helicase domain-containing protein [Clostridiales bacterium]|jgi:uncharacterized protein (TIGR00375 family)|nr:UvrD-helicase domain-containing protein [Clostridiales bacterium]